MVALLCRSSTVNRYPDSAGVRLPSSKQDHHTSEQNMNHIDKY